MSERTGGGEYGAEVGRDPEVDKLLEFIDAYKQIQEIMTWLVEASPGADPALKGVRRAHLHRLMQQLGLDPESPDALNKLENTKAVLSDRARHPRPRVEVPGVRFFESRIKEIVAKDEQSSTLPTFSYAVDGVADLRDVTQHAHTDWRSVVSDCTGATWIHGVATVMADPVAYSAWFSELSIDQAHRTPDHLTVGEDWSIQNGRHRSLAARCLGETFIDEANMSQWVKVEVE